MCSHCNPQILRFYRNFAAWTSHFGITYHECFLDKSRDSTAESDSTQQGVWCWLTMPNCCLSLRFLILFLFRHQTTINRLGIQNSEWTILRYSTVFCFATYRAKCLYPHYLLAGQILLVSKNGGWISKHVFLIYHVKRMCIYIYVHMYV